MWSLGDYAAVAAHLEPHAIELAQRSRLQTGWRSSTSPPATATSPSPRLAWGDSRGH